MESFYQENGLILKDLPRNETKRKNERKKRTRSTSDGETQTQAKTHHKTKPSQICEKCLRADKETRNSDTAENTHREENALQLRHLSP
jgi:hypothetical protein